MAVKKSKPKPTLAPYDQKQQKQNKATQVAMDSRYGKKRTGSGTSGRGGTNKRT